MLDLQYICDNLEAVQANSKNRGVTVDFDRLLELRTKRREVIEQGDALRSQQKEVSGQIPKADKQDRPALIEQGKKLREQVGVIENDQKQIEEELKSLQSQIPNITHPDSPIAIEETGSKVLRTWGDPKPKPFPAKDHVEIAEALDLIDFEAGSKVAGHGFYYLKNEAVLLELALVQFAVSKLRNAGFTLYTTPDLARDEVLAGTGFSPRGNETQIYSVENTDLSLIATAEITLGGMLKDTIIDREELPLKVAGISHCFRTEAGAHGKATRGIYRVHQFTKVEMFGFTAPDTEISDAFHSEVLALEEEIFQELGIPYQVLDICTGDMGGPAYRKYDLEAWMPGRGEQGAFGEVTSCSNCTDYQSRRMAIRCREKGQKGTQFVHTLNGTAVAISRAMIALLENYQQEDGSVVIPEVLRPWVGCDVITPKK